MPAHPGYDPDATSMAIDRHGGGSLDPLTMIHQDVQTVFKIVGEHKKEAEDEATAQAALVVEVNNLKEQVKTLQNRLWQLLAVFLGAIITGGVGLWFTS